MTEWTLWHERHSDKICLIAGVDCWIWTGAHGGRGYGRVSYHQKAEFAHRASFIEAGGSFAAGPMVRHKCGVPLCVRPGHLVSGTTADNSRDMAEMFTSRGHLVERDVLAIRAEYDSGLSLSEIASRHGIAYGTVYPIVTGRAYKHVAPNDLPRSAQRSPRKLDADKVRLIRSRLKDGVTHDAIGAEFNVAPSVISRIKTGHRWAHVD